MRRLLILVFALATVAGITGLVTTSSGGATPPAGSTAAVALYSGPIGGNAHLLRLPDPGATQSTPTAGTLAWHVICIHQFGFCADFPYVAGSLHSFERHTDYTSATSVSGHLVNFTSNLWVADNGGGYCSTEFTDGCNPTGEHNQYYFVEIIHSKYTDPWQALSAINGGVGRHPVFIRVHGYLTCPFKGIYGGPGITVWAHGRVYYLESANLALKANPRAIVRRFLLSIRFIKVSR